MVIIADADISNCRQISTISDATKTHGALLVNKLRVLVAFKIIPQQTRLVNTGSTTTNMLMFSLVLVEGERRMILHVPISPVSLIGYPRHYSWKVCKIWKWVY